MSKSQIVEKAFENFNGICINWIEQDNAAKNLIFYNKFFTLGSPKAYNRLKQLKNDAKTFSRIAEAARVLTVIELRVVVNRNQLLHAFVLQNASFTSRWNQCVQQVINSKVQAVLRRHSRGLESNKW